MSPLCGKNRINKHLGQSNEWGDTNAVRADPLAYLAYIFDISLETSVNSRDPYHRSMDQWIGLFFGRQWGWRICVYVYSKMML